MTTNYKNLPCALLLAALWTVLVFHMGYPDQQGLGEFFSVSIYYIVTLFIGLAFGTVLLLLRVSNVIKNASSLLYTFAGTLNASVGILAVILILSKSMTEPTYIRLFLLSFVLGVVILSDIGLSNQKDS